MTGATTGPSKSPTLSIRGGRALTAAGLEPATVTIDGELIRSVDRPGRDGPPPIAGPETGGREIDSAEIDSAEVDADGLIVAPGFVDLQINGGFGHDLAGDPWSMWALGRLLPRHGVTSFLPTIVSSPPAVTDGAIDAFAAGPPDHLGAEPLGLHFEGPMLNPDRAGAHRPAHLVRPDQAIIANWSRSSGVVLVTLAPELPDAPSIIARLVAAGVTVSAGHSAAGAAEARAGIEAGATMITHLFNAMAPLEHRSPNLVGVGLTDPTVVVGLIVDGVHVDPVVVDIAWRAKGPAGTVLITDAVAPMGRGPGAYELGRTTIFADDLRVVDQSGRLAGSVLTMDRAVRNLLDYTGCSVAEALVAASRTPADAIARSDRGRLEAGAVADLVLLDDSLEVTATICRGCVAYVADDARDRMSSSTAGER
ncbi:MAG: N-acetylglucosamine-6-phosphate deacetylase [Acidimicrobiales bacterium]